MNIAFFTKELPSNAPNGVSCQAHRLANSLVTLGHTVTCFSFSGKPIDALYSHRQLFRKAHHKISSLFEAGLVFASMQTAGYDIVHFHGDDYFVKGSTNRVRTFYGSAIFEARFEHDFMRKMRQALFYILEWVSCFRQGTKVGISRSTVQALPLVKNVVHCGVPLGLFTPGRTKSPFPSILFIGDLDSRKRGSLLIKAFQTVVLPAMPDAVLTIIGPQECNGLNIVCKKNVDQEELINHFRQSWVYCCPSSYEGFGVPLCEAMACGTAVVACENKTVSEIITHEHDGLVCSKAALGEALVLLLGNARVRAKFVDNGLETVKQYDAKKIAEQYLNLYEKIAVK